MANGKSLMLQAFKARHPRLSKAIGRSSGPRYLLRDGGVSVTATKRDKRSRPGKRGPAHKDAAPGPAEAGEAESAPPAAPSTAAAEALAWDAKGREARARGDTLFAIQYFERALALAPGEPLFHNNIGNAYLAASAYEQAERAYRSALRLKPDLAIAWTNLGYVLMNQDRELPGAVECFERAIALDPRDGNALFFMGTALRRMRRPAQALPPLEKALAMDRQPGRVLYQMGLADVALGRSAEALENFRRARDDLAGDVFSEIEILSIEAERNVLPENAKRVAVHINQRFHFAILKPLFDALARRHRTIFTCDARRLTDFDPEIVIVADAQSEGLRRFVPRAIYVYTRHGLISKNSPYKAARAADYACITSEASRKQYVENGGIPRKDFWITGYVQMDPLFRGDEIPLPFALPAGKKTVLYAPTFNDHLTSAHMLGPRTVELIRGDRRDIAVVIKPHPHICSHREGWMTWWRQAAAREPDVFLAGDPAADLIPYLQAADLLVSDASSAALIYLALDRPIVLVTNPDAAKDPARYDPKGPEWTWRDMGEEVFDVAALPAAVARGLNDPAARRERRQHYRDLLFGDRTDGHAAERIVEHISALELARTP